MLINTKKYLLILKKNIIKNIKENVIIKFVEFFSNRFLKKQGTNLMKINY